MAKVYSKRYSDHNSDKMGKAVYQGREGKISFTCDKVYSFLKEKDGFGDYYSILDDSGEWYRYSVRFFESHFRVLNV